MIKRDSNDIARERGPAGLAADLDHMTMTAKAKRRSTNSTITTSTAGEWPVPLPFDHHGGMPLFPVDALPDWVRDMVDAVVQSTQTPPDLAGGLVLAILGMCGAGKLHVHIKSDYIEPLNLYTLTALPPGCRKSSVFSIMTEPVVEWERVEGERTGPIIAKARESRNIDLKRRRRGQPRRMMLRIVSRSREKPRILPKTCSSFRYQVSRAYSVTT